MGINGVIPHRMTPLVFPLLGRLIVVGLTTMNYRVHFDLGRRPSIRFDPGCNVMCMSGI